MEKKAEKVLPPFLYVEMRAGLKGSVMRYARKEEAGFYYICKAKAAEQRRGEARLSV